MNHSLVSRVLFFPDFIRISSDSCRIMSVLKPKVDQSFNPSRAESVSYI